MATYIVRDFGHNFTFECPDDQVILDAAEEAGLDLPFAGRAGASATEIALLLSGSVDNTDGSYISEAEKLAGFFLTDTSYPLSNVVMLTGDSAFEELEKYRLAPLEWKKPVEM